MSGILVTVYRSGGEAPVGFENITDAKGTSTSSIFSPAPGRSSSSLLVLSLPHHRGDPCGRGHACHLLRREGSYNPFDKVVTAERERKEVSRTVNRERGHRQDARSHGRPLGRHPELRRSGAQPRWLGRHHRAPDRRRKTPRSSWTALRCLSSITSAAFRSVLPVGMIDSLEFYPGNFSPYYGRATGGIVDISTRSSSPQGERLFRCESARLRPFILRRPSATRLRWRLPHVAATSTGSCRA